MKRQIGVTLVELMIGVAIVALLIMLAAPSLTAFIQNRQIRTTAESISGALQLTRAEAMKSNATAMFSLTTTVDDNCILNDNGPNWVVSSSDPTAACATGTQVVQKRADAESTANTTIVATRNTAPVQALGGQIVFNGLGRVTPNQAADIWIDVSNPVGGNCGTAAGDMRCLRVVVSPGGMIRLCDPNVAYSLTNSQGC